MSANTPLPGRVPRARFARSPALWLVCLVLLGVPLAPRAQPRLELRSLANMPAEGSGTYPRFELAYVAPAMHKWYAPRHHIESYTRPWYVTDRMSARQIYERYVSTGLLGDVWYDGFGQRIGRGWLVYSWEQEQPARYGSVIRSGQLGSRFNNLVIGSDEAGGNAFRLMVGHELDVRFTPLTLFKPRYDGLRLDYASDRYSASLLLSRPSGPEGSYQTNATHLAGGHLDTHLGDLARLGLTYVNAHNALTDMEFTAGNPLHGSLTTLQNETVGKLWVRLRDDSPEDYRAGATLYRYDIVLQDTSGARLRGSEIGLAPRIEGGRLHHGALVADGSEAILLEYDLEAFAGVTSGAIRRATVELAVANDYRVEIASNLQTDGETRDPQAVFLTAARAAGNVQDESNGVLLKLDYSLPTANELIGVNWDVVRWRDLSFQGEAVLNRQIGKYPRRDATAHHVVVDYAHAAYAVAAYNRYPVAVLAELFTMDDEYATTYWLTQSSGLIKYDSPEPQLYEFVDDDDDRDGIPEWLRPYQRSSGGVAFPGFDENRDFAHDLNQNGGPLSADRNLNMVPDYDEPFLRFRSERPEFLFGPDMNHNGTVDRFENDQEADYPYRRDHRGYNTYLKLSAGPDIEILAGRQDVGLISGDGHSRSAYAMGTWVRQLRRGGRLRLYGFGETVRDDIADDLQVWSQPVGAVGRMRDRPDALPGRDAHRATLYADLDQRPGAGIRLFHRVKWDRWWQRRSRAQVKADEGRMAAGFQGMVNRAEWTLPVGLGTVQPRWKSEYRSSRPFSTTEPIGRSLRESALVLWTQPLLAEGTRVGYYPRYGRGIYDTQLQGGLEWTWLWMLAGQHDDADEDLASRSVVIQVANRVGYLGYNLAAGAGLLLSSYKETGEPRHSASTVFISITAGLRQ